MRHKKILAALLVLLSVLTVFSFAASALSWDGSSAGGSTNAVNGSATGYVIRATNDSNCVVGYRFSVVNSSGGMKVNKVIDVFRNTSNGNNAYSTSAKFSVKYNKKQLIANKNAKRTTTLNTTNCIKESAIGFATALPNPSGVETWQAYEANINKVLSKLGVGTTSNMVYGDKVIIEPLFDICLAGEYQALTVSEIAYCGRSVKGSSSDGGKSNGTSSTWGFISNYTNRIWPNKLYTPDGQGLWTSASTIASSTKATFNTILTKGYGAGIAYNETANLTYTIKFNGNSSTGGSTASMSMVKDVSKNLTANGFTRTGYTFKNWNKKTDGSGTSYKNKQSVKNLTDTQGATVNFYAQWKPNTYTISFNGNGKTGGSTASMSMTYDTAKNLTANGFTKTGHSFNGWNTKSSGSGTSYKNKQSVKNLTSANGATITLYARWTPNKYTVSYNANGGSGAPADQTKTYGVNLTLSSTKPTRTGYTFVKWNTKADGTGTNYNSGSQYTGNANLNLYAVWTPIKYTVTYNANGGSGAPGNQTKTYGVNLTLSSTKPTRTGYTFSKWNTKADGTGIQKKTVEEARAHFNRVGADITVHFARLGSKCTEIDLTERLRIIHDFCRPKEAADYHFDLRDAMRKGQSFKDYISPDGFEFKADHFKVGDKFARVLFIRDYPSYIKDKVIWEITDTNRNMIFNFDIVPVSTDEAQKYVEKQALGVETNIANYQRKQNSNNNYTSVIPYDMEVQRKEIREFLDDITARDQKMFKVIMTIMHTADSLNELNADTEAIQAMGRNHMCQIGVLKYQQLDGFNATLPIGINKIEARRTLTTESLAVFMPFKVQEIQHDGGVFQGVNVISKNMIIVNRSFLLNGNCFILGVSGSGKSFTAKEEMVSLLLSTNADVIIIDPEREYKALVEAMDGQVVRLSATSRSHINCLDINKEYADGANPLAMKSEFVLSLFEQVCGKNEVTAMQKSIIDRCLANVYKTYIGKKYKGKPPTLVELCKDLREQPEPEATEIAVAMELFASGSQNTFAQQTNVNVKSRLICYDILDLGSQLMPIGMLVVLDNILNRITQNRAEGKETYIFIDEIYLLFQHEYSANFLFTLWKRVRKYGAYCTGITQNVDDLLQSHTARTMLANSEFIIMLNQGGTDREDLANLLQISETQMTHITNVEVGHGLVKVGSALVPFERKFPQDTELYKLMSTKLKE